VRHRFPDAEGTELDGGTNGAGRFRVLLHVEDNLGSKNSYRQDWASQGLVVVGSGTTRWRLQVQRCWTGVKIYPGEWTELPDLTKEHEVFSGESPNLHADRRALRITPPRGTASWIFPRTADTPFI